MNFLAHIYLSGGDLGLIIGNYIGDDIKGNQWKDIDADIARGVLMHRQIDYFTDSHPVCLAVTKHLRPYFGKWSAVAIDLYWDHFLASSWADHHDTPLGKFSSEIYALLKENKSSLTPQSRKMLQHMSQYDWLTSYASPEGIGSAFNGLSRRISIANTLHRGNEILEIESEFLREHFELFFPEIKSLSQGWKNLRKPL